MGIYEKFYDEHNLGETSQYADYSKKDLVVEAEYLESALYNILEYMDNGGTDLDVIHAEVFDAIYESRI